MYEFVYVLDCIMTSNTLSSPGRICPLISSKIKNRNPICANFTVVPHLHCSIIVIILEVVKTTRKTILKSNTMFLDWTVNQHLHLRQKYQMYKNKANITVSPMEISEVGIYRVMKCSSVNFPPATLKTSTYWLIFWNGSTASILRHG